MALLAVPVGAAGVRGTTLAVSYVPDPSGNGKATYTLSVTEGEVEFIDSNGNKKVVKAGQEIVITVRETVDPVTGKTKVTEILEIVIRDIADDRRRTIDGVEDAGVIASELIFDDVLNRQLPELLDQIREEENVVIEPEKTTEVDP